MAKTAIDSLLDKIILDKKSNGSAYLLPTITEKEIQDAKELVEKFMVELYELKSITGNEGDGNYERRELKVAKQCVLILCNEILIEIIDAHDKLGMGEIGLLKDYIPYIYWQSVKSKIEKL